MKKITPLVSIIIPVYGVEKWIEKCLNSALSQDYDNIEIIIVNDNTKDNSLFIIKNLLTQYKGRKKVNLISHSKNMGLAKARETGIKAASGDYIFHLDADDWIEADCISLLISHLNLNPKLDIITGNFINIYPDRNIINKLCFKSIPKDPIDISKLMMERSMFWNIWNRLIRKDLYNNIVIPDINNGEDYITTIRLMYKAKEVLYIPNLTYNYNHLNEHSFQKNKYDIKNIIERENAVTFLQNEFKNIKNLQYALNIGQLKSIITNILLIRDISDFKFIKIPKNLLNIRYVINLKKRHILVLIMFLLKKYKLILNVLNQK